MKTYMSGICMHISSDIEVYWPIYENFDKFLSIYVAQFTTTNFHIPKHAAEVRNSDFWKNKNFHISVEKCKIPTYIGQKMIFEKFAYIGQYSTIIYRSIYDTKYWSIYAYIFRFKSNSKWQWNIWTKIWNCL